MLDYLKELLKDLKDGEIEYLTITDLHKKVFSLETAIEILEKRRKENEL